MLKPITNKGLFWELRNSIWTLWTFFPFGFFNYISFFYIAARLKDKKLLVYGVLYALPFMNVMGLDSIENPPTWYEDFSYIALFIVWIISIVHVIKVRRHYLLSKPDTVSYADQLAEENRQLQQKLQSLTTNKEEPKVTLDIPEAPIKAVRQTPNTIENTNVNGAPIDLNVATEKELASITEIGPLLSSKIILERQQIGRFTSYEHFTQVMDFKPHIAHKLKKHVTVIALETPKAPTSTKQGRVIDY